MFDAFGRRDFASFPAVAVAGELAYGQLAKKPFEW